MMRHRVATALCRAVPSSASQRMHTRVRDALDLAIVGPRGSPGEGWRAEARSPGSRCGAAPDTVPAPRRIVAAMAIEGSATIVIDAPIDRVYAVAADVAGSPRWQPQFKAAEVLERDADGHQTLVHMVTDGKVRDLHSDVRFSFDPPSGLRWRQVKGDLKAVEGAWAFEDLGAGRTRATYALSVDLGRILGAVIRGPVVGILRQQLIDSMPGKLKRDVEG
jgi:uncharacterized membrane protein